MPDVLHLQSNLFNMQRLIKLRSFKALFSRDIINASLRNILDNCIEDIVRQQQIRWICLGRYNIQGFS